MYKTATISKCNNYRYDLTRIWENICLNKNLNLVNFIGLNPSTADGVNNDRTLNRLIYFAKKNNFDGLILTNLFAYRSTSPKIIREIKNPIGDECNSFIEDSILKSKTIIACWGNNGTYLHRNKQVIDIINKNNRTIYCFGKTSQNQPKHPLYLPNNTELEIYKL